MNEVCHRIFPLLIVHDPDITQMMLIKILSDSISYI